MKNGKAISPLERVIRPIVEGQIKGFIKEHPSILQGVDWYKPRQADRATTLINSLAKRIVLDLTCSATTARLRQALLEQGPDGAEDVAVELVNCGNGSADGRSPVRAACPHAIWERDTASEADGLCPLCLAAEVASLKLTIEKLLQRR